jgi:tungstate transport system substrate-binding protein
MKKSVSFIVSFALIFGLVLPAGNIEQTISKAYAATSLKAGSKGVLVRNTNLRTSPNLSGKVILTAKKGTSLTVTKTYNSWYAVTLSNGKKGYMVKSNITSAPAAVVPAKPGKPTTPTTPSKPTATLPVVEKTMVLATTTSTRDTGLLDYLVPIFEKKYNTSVKVISVGTGEAIEMGKRGDADVLLVHSPSQEKAFVDSGFGINRKDVMYNEFFIVGPKDDPAKISGQVDAQTAMKKLADAKATFISRGDKSGTHTKELALWSKYSVKPQGEKWYMESGQGMGDTLTMAAEKGAYTLVDSGTWFAFEDKVNLKVVVKGDKDLFNPYGVIAVNPAKYPNIHNKAANAFIDFITSAEGQKVIAGFKKNGKQLFTPDAR